MGGEANSGRSNPQFGLVERSFVKKNLIRPVNEAGRAVGFHPGHSLFSREGAARAARRTRFGFQRNLGRSFAFSGPARSGGVEASGAGCYVAGYETTP